jgi:hypothetical protein
MKEADQVWMAACCLYDHHLNLLSKTQGVVWVK